MFVSTEQAFRMKQANNSHYQLWWLAPSKRTNKFHCVTRSIYDERCSIEIWSWLLHFHFSQGKTFAAADFKIRKAGAKLENNSLNNSKNKVWHFEIVYRATCWISTSWCCFLHGQMKRHGVEHTKQQTVSWTVSDLTGIKISAWRCKENDRARRLLKGSCKVD